MSLLSLGTQSLIANQTALNVTGQNITNVNTEGYTRQSTIFLSRPEQNGVFVDDIARITDEFLSRQIRSDSASFNSSDAFLEFASELDDTLASEITSISTALDNYYGALQTSIDNPVSLPNRELFIAEAEALVLRFNDLDANIRRQNDSVNSRIESAVDSINAIAQNIATLNGEISLAQASGQVTSELLDQRDTALASLAEQIGITTLEQATGEVSVFVGNGEPLVVGLSATTVAAIPSPADSSQLNIGLLNQNSLSDITNQISGGRVGGTLEYREEILGSALDEIGRIALVFAETSNEQHQRGIDFNGDAGGLLFTDINEASAVTNRVLAERDNVSSVVGGIRIDNASALQASEYSLTFNDNGGFNLLRESDGARFSNLSLTQEAVATDVDEDGEFFFDNVAGTLTLRLDGFTLTLDSGSAFNEGDGYILRPVRNGAAELDNVINEATQLALASPLTVSQDISNAGNASATVSITDIDFERLSNVAGELTPPLEIEFLSDIEVVSDDPANLGSANNLQITDFSVFSGVTYPLTITEDGSGDFDITDSATPANSVTGVALSGGQLDLTASFGITLDITGVAAASGESFTVQHTDSTDVEFYEIVDAEGDRQVNRYVPGDSIQLQGFEVTIINSPDINDRFTVDLNTDGVSDNRNALLLAGLQFEDTIGDASFQDSYGQLVQRVGSQTAVAQINNQASLTVLNANEARLSSVAGVNLDEEAALLVQFQQAYQASAQLIRTAQTIFDTLLQSV